MFKWRLFIVGWYLLLALWPGVVCSWFVALYYLSENYFDFGLNGSLLSLSSSSSNQWNG